MFFFILFLSPSIYFFLKFKGLTPNIASDRITYFNFENFLIILSIIFIYLLPFFISIYKDLKIKFSIKNFIYFFFLFLIFFLLSFNNITQNSNYYVLKNGGGLIYKIIFHTNLISFDFFFKKLFFIFFSYLGLFLLIIFCKNNINFFIYLFSNLIIFSFTNVVFQEYFDPLIFFCIFSLTNLIKRENLLYTGGIVFFYHSFLFIIFWIYRYIVAPI